MGFFARLATLLYNYRENIHHKLSNIWDWGSLNAGTPRILDRVRIPWRLAKPEHLVWVFISWILISIVRISSLWIITLRIETFLDSLWIPHRVPIFTWLSRRSLRMRAYFLGRKKKKARFCISVSLRSISPISYLHRIFLCTWERPPILRWVRGVIINWSISFRILVGFSVSWSLSSCSWMSTRRCLTRYRWVSSYFITIQHSRFNLRHLISSIFYVCACTICWGGWMSIFLGGGCSDTMNASSRSSSNWTFLYLWIRSPFCRNAWMFCLNSISLERYTSSKNRM